MTHSQPLKALTLGGNTLNFSEYLRRIGATSLALVLFPAAVAFGAPVTIDISATVDTVIDASVSGLTVDDTFSGTFVYDTNEANADPGADTDGSDRPGHEYSSFYEFSGSPYEVTLDVPFANTSPVAVVVNDDLPITADVTGGLISDGTYDWIEILGGSTISVCNKTPPETCGDGEFDPADGQEWTLAIFGDTSWITDGSLVPDNLPGTYTAIVVAIDFDASGNEIGVALATIDDMTVSTVPVPAAAWLFGSALGLLGWIRRKKA